MSAQHARITFSSLARTVQCPGSVTMCERYPDPSTAEADEGTIAHAVACRVAGGEAVPNQMRLGDGTPYVDVDPDMRRGAEMWRDHVQAAGGGLLEIPCQAVAIHETECWGTPDFRAYDPAGHVLRVSDYKYGFEEVPAAGNWQLIAAASAMLSELNLDSKDRHLLTIQMSIVQPRGYHRGGPVRTVTIRSRDLVEREVTARYAVKEALSDSPRLRRGPECVYCPARHACPELQNHGYAAADYGARAEPNELEAGALGHELALIDDTIELLQARRTGLYAQAEAAVRGGATVHGYGMQPGRSNLTWNNPAAALALFPAIAKTAEPITPTQARDRKLVPAEVVNALASRPPVAMTLKRIKSDKLFAR